jgi:hypothetical protein
MPNCLQLLLNEVYLMIQSAARFALNHLIAGFIRERTEKEDIVFANDTIVISVLTHPHFWHSAALSPPLAFTAGATIGCECMTGESTPGRGNGGGVDTTAPRWPVLPTTHCEHVNINSGSAASDLDICCGV